MPTVIIDQKKCEGKADCIAVCPQNVFEMRRPENLGFFTRLKVNIHGGKQAFAVNESACIACMKCVEACPEKAIKIIAP